MTDEELAAQTARFNQTLRQYGRAKALHSRLGVAMHEDGRLDELSSLLANIQGEIDKRRPGIVKRKNPPRLNEKDAVDLQGTVESEGFDYAFRYYSDFATVKDKKFQSLRKAYVKAAQDLSDYCRLEEDLPRCPECGDGLEKDGVCPTCAEAKA